MPSIPTKPYAIVRAPSPPTSIIESTHSSSNTHCVTSCPPICSLSTDMVSSQSTHQVGTQKYTYTARELWGRQRASGHRRGRLGSASEPEPELEGVLIGDQAEVQKGKRDGFLDHDLCTRHVHISALGCGVPLTAIFVKRLPLGYLGRLHMVKSCAKYLRPLHAPLGSIRCPTNVWERG